MDSISLKGAAENGKTLEELAKRARGFKAGSPFLKYPIVGSAVLSNGEKVGLPYHCYDSDALLIWGDCDRAYAEKVIEGPWLPLPAKGRPGRVSCCFWIVDYHDTGIGPYKEFILNFGTIHTSKEHLIPRGGVTPYDVLVLNSNKVANPYCYKIWLSKQTPLDFGRELNGCDKYMLSPNHSMEFETSCSGATARFEVHHSAGERNGGSGLLCKGKLDLNRHMLNHSYDRI